MTDGDLSDVRDLTASNCRSCDGILDPIQKVYDKGGSFSTDGWRVAAARIKSQSQRSATVPTGLVFAAGKTVPEAGAEPVSYGIERHIVVFKLAKTDVGWRVKFVGFLS